MSDKPFTQLWKMDQLLRQNYHPGPNQKSNPFVLRMVSGFELFNTRPYHNYETFSSGYEACDGEFYSLAEDLDDCVNGLLFAKLYPDDFPHDALKKQRTVGRATVHRVYDFELERFGFQKQAV